MGGAYLDIPSGTGTDKKKTKTAGPNNNTSFFLENTLFALFYIYDLPYSIIIIV
jgi:hypothetical protein